MKSDNGTIIGVDIGGTQVRVGQRTAAGGLHSERMRTPADASAGVDAILAMIANVAPAGAAAVGISCAGPLDFTRGITNPLNLPGWHGYPLVAKLQEHLGVPVYLDNDANCAGLAEWAALGSQQQTLVYYTISTGVGTGVIINGAVHHGQHDTEGGHQIVWPDGPPCACGSRGCLEAVISGTGLLARYGQRAEDLSDSAVWDEVAKYLAIGITNTAMLLCPDTVVIGGGLIVRGEQIFGPLRRYTSEMIHLVPVPTILPATLGQDSGLLGAIVLAEQQHCTN